MPRRPSKKVLEKVISFLQDNGVHLYTGAADLTTGQRDFGCMDIGNADQVIAIYERNKTDDWKEPEY